MLQVTKTDQASPWHEGELKIQRSVGVAERMGDIGKRFVRSFLLDEHREFYLLLPFIVPNDPADAGLDDGDSVGLLGIELHSRRRNRMKGKVRRSDDRSFDVAVAQSYGNCPQYIQQREFAFTRDPA